MTPSEAVIAADRQLAIARRREAFARAALVQSFRETAHYITLATLETLRPSAPPADTWRAAVAAQHAKGLRGSAAIVAAMQAAPDAAAAARAPKYDPADLARERAQRDAARDAAVRAEIAAMRQKG